MNYNPLVSVSIVTYNHKDYIEQCLDGILMQQTTFPYEIILGEDESDDGTREICIEYANKYPDKIKLFLRSRKDVIYINGNPTGRFNFIENLKACKGKYIALCDGDDYWIDKTKLQMQFDFLKENKKYGIVYTLKKNLYPDGKFIDDKPVAINQRTTDIDDLLAQNFICASTTFFRNKIRKLNFADWYYESPYGDWPLYMYLMQNGKKIFCIEKLTTVYRKNIGITSGVTNNAIKSLKNQYNVFKGMQLDSNYKAIHHKISKRIYTLNVNLMSAYNKDRQFFKSMESFINLLIKYPNYFEFKLVKNYIKSLLKGVKIIK